MTAGKKLSGQETIKTDSHYLRGNIVADLAGPHADVSDETYELLKFHGSYFGYDRDTATERKQQGLEKEYEFMVRIKMPAGRLTAQQYLAMDALADDYANGTLRITTRETFQFHCVKKTGMKPLVAAINHALLSTLGGCGDVVRNIMACPAPIKDAVHAKIEEDAYLLARHFAPRTNAYAEVWLDGQKMEEYPFWPPAAPADNPEPIYGNDYMPRKFKIGIAEPQDNCIDVMTHDFAILPLFEDGQLRGYNFALGGGLGMNHNNAKTYPRLATPVAFVPPELFLPASEAVVRLQKEHGDRSDRKHARLKYLIAEKGEVWAKEVLEGYLGRGLNAPKAMRAFAVDDHMGWHTQGDGKWFLGIPIDSGRILDNDGMQLRTGLREVIAEYGMNLRLTADQNILLCDIEEGEKRAVQEKLRAFGIKFTENITPLHRNTLACVALPTCGKALAEAERVKLPMVAAVERELSRYGLTFDTMSFRIAGCPNGCSRPYVGDIGVVGRMPGYYALFVGGDFAGTRLNEKIFDKVPEEGIATALSPMFALYAKERAQGEAFGDYCARVGITYVKQAALGALPEHDWAK